MDLVYGSVPFVSGSGIPLDGTPRKVIPEKGEQEQATKQETTINTAPERTNTKRKWFPANVHYQVRRV